MRGHFSSMTLARSVIALVRQELMELIHRSITFPRRALRLNDERGETCRMSTVSISKRFQVTIPKEIRRRFYLRAGQRIAMLEYDGHIRLIPLQPIQRLRGLLKGMDTTRPRDGNAESVVRSVVAAARWLATAEKTW